MAYRCGSRDQMALLPSSIEEYVPADAPVRAYDMLIEALDFQALEIPINEFKVGNSSYHPKSMMKLLVYGYSYGIRSSRKLEQAVYDNMSFIWLMGGIKPDHKTIAEFRRKNKKSISKVLRQCVRLCIKLNLIAGNVLFVDGSKIAANASKKSMHKRKWYEEELKEIDERIEKLLKECEAIDERERKQPSFVSMQKELCDKQRLKKRVSQALSALDGGKSKQSSLSDPECKNMKFKQGFHPGYNVQSVVDDKYGLIAHAEVTPAVNDLNQFASQVDQAQEALGIKCEVACADSGYADTDELAKIDSQGIHVVVPSQRQALHKPEQPFSKSEFSYDREQDCYRCPEGNKLELVRREKTSGKRHYRIKKPGLCQRCKHFGKCTESGNGRTILRLGNEDTKGRLELQYSTTKSQEIYAKRKSRVELPFGHMKRNLGADHFLVRGISGALVETSLLATCFNVARMLTLKGVKGAIEELMIIRCPVIA